MSKLGHFFAYNNIVPITISAILLGSSATYAYTNPEIVYERTERVVSIDNTYIAAVDFDTFSPSVEILSVEEDDTAYYVTYEFTTIALIDSVWQNIVSIQELVIPIANLGQYRDLGLYVTEELRELVLSEEKRLRETQVFERRSITRKQLAVEYSGIIGGRLSPEVQTIDGYDPLVQPPTIETEPETFARPDERSTVSKPIAAKKVAVVTESESPVTDTVSTDEGSDTNGSGQSSTDSSDTTEPDQTDESENTTIGTTTATTTVPVSNSSTSSAQTLPSITLLGDPLVTLQLGDSYTDLGIVVTEYDDLTSETSVTVNGNEVTVVELDTAISSTYEIVYTVTAPNDIQITAERTVTVTDVETQDEPDESVVEAVTESEPILETVGANEVTQSEVGDVEVAVEEQETPLEIVEIESETEVEITELDSANLE